MIGKLALALGLVSINSAVCHTNTHRNCDTRWPELPLKRADFGSHPGQMLTA
jgi:hypothetical protein